ncbi:MAG: hypothetical protein R2827_12830 [Bdellovibrionales bacterium]
MESNQGTTNLSRRRFASFDTTSGVATSFSPNIGGAPYSLATDGINIFAGGDFTQVNNGTYPQGHDMALFPLVLP